MRGNRQRLLGAVVAGVLAAASLHAQPMTRRAALASRNIELRETAAGAADSTSSRAEEKLSSAPSLIVAGTWQTTAPSRKNAAPWWAPVASAIVPGSGQLAMGQQRGVAYLVAEVYLVVQALSARRDWSSQRDEYRSVAADVARRQFGGDLPIGSWEYYEAMEGLPTGALPNGSLESGVFDLLPGGVIDPETDEATYNGATWRIARETYWRDPANPPATNSPEYQQALAEYERYAIRDEFRWSWRDAQLQLDVYRQTIASSNRTYQRSVSMAGLVGMNHLASLIDAYITTRIRRYGGVRAAGLKLEGIESGVRAVGDPASRQYRISSSMRFVPITR